MSDRLDLPVPDREAPRSIPESLSTAVSTSEPRHWTSRPLTIIIAAALVVILVGVGWTAFDSQGGEEPQHGGTAAAAIHVDRTAAEVVTERAIAATYPDRFAPLSLIDMPGAIEKPDRAPAWQQLSGRIQVALVIDDLGMNARRSKEVADLGAPLTMSFLPYAADLKAQIVYARVREHDVFAHIPMEPLQSNIDLGANALLTDMTDAQIGQALSANLEVFPVVHGINNHMGSLFTSNAGSMRPLIEQIKDRGLLFLDSRTSVETQGERIAKSVGLPGLRRHVFLDHEAPSDPDEVLQQLALLEEEAATRGIAVAIGHPHRATLEALRQWIPQARARGILFVRMRDVAAQYVAAEESRLVAESAERQP